MSRALFTLLNTKNVEHLHQIPQSWEDVQRRIIIILTPFASKLSEEETYKVFHILDQYKINVAYRLNKWKEKEIIFQGIVMKAHPLGDWKDIVLQYLLHKDNTMYTSLEKEERIVMLLLGYQIIGEDLWNRIKAVIFALPNMELHILVRLLLFKNIGELTTKKKLLYVRKMLRYLRRDIEKKSRVDAMDFLLVLPLIYKSIVGHLSTHIDKISREILLLVHFFVTYTLVHGSLESRIKKAFKINRLTSIKTPDYDKVIDCGRQIKQAKAVQINNARAYHQMPPSLEKQRMLVILTQDNVSFTQLMRQSPACQQAYAWYFFYYIVGEGMDKITTWTVNRLYQELITHDPAKILVNLKQVKHVGKRSRTV
jgi:hypothetical protein